MEALGVAAVAFYTVLRFGAGLFFMLSGFNKLVNPERHQQLVSTLEADGVALVRFNQWWVPAVEFSAGAAVALGLLTSLAAAGLFVICAVAGLCEAKKRVDAMSPINGADRVDDYLYLPEIVWALVLAFIVAVGGGPVALDRLVLTYLL